MMGSLRFYCVSIAILFLFIAIMAFAILIAFSRRSGSTGMDIAEIQKQRYEHALKLSSLTSWGQI